MYAISDTAINKVSNALPPMISPTARVNDFNLTAVIAITSSGSEVETAVNTPPTSPSDMFVWLMILIPVIDNTQPAVPTINE